MVLRMEGRDKTNKGYLPGMKFGRFVGSSKLGTTLLQSIEDADAEFRKSNKKQKNILANCILTEERFGRERYETGYHIFNSVPFPSRGMTFSAKSFASASQPFFHGHISLNGGGCATVKARYSQKEHHIRMPTECQNKLVGEIVCVCVVFAVAVACFELS